MALKSDVFKQLVKAGNWSGFETLVKNGEYDKYSDNLRSIFWDYLCEHRRLKEIEDCLRPLEQSHGFKTPYSTDDKIMGVLNRDQNALVYAVDSSFKHMNKLAIRVIERMLETSDYSFWPKLGNHTLVQEFFKSELENDRGKFSKPDIFNGIIEAKLKGSRVPRELESLIFPLVRKQPFVNTMSSRNIPVSGGEFNPRGRHAHWPMNFFDRACQKDNPKMLDLTISTLKVNEFEYHNLDGFGLVDSMLSRFSFNCLKEALARDPLFLIRPREYQDTSQYYDDDPVIYRGVIKTHHPIDSWINNLGNQNQEKEIRMMRVIYDNFETLLKDKENCPEIVALKKTVEELEKPSRQKLFVFEVQSILDAAFKKTLEIVNPEVEQYPSVHIPKTPERTLLWR